MTKLCPVVKSDPSDVDDGRRQALAPIYSRNPTDTLFFWPHDAKDTKCTRVHAPDGLMRITYEPVDLLGHPNCGTFVVRYYFSAGIEPLTGLAYEGVTHVTYFPGTAFFRSYMPKLRDAFSAGRLFRVEDGRMEMCGVPHKHAKTGVLGFPDSDFPSRFERELTRVTIMDLGLGALGM